ncbi:hypothetical protein [Aliikangiella sp. G2MR2-5]|uniref:hypothetical protein n=1 Tax=Aliikangiella sp. G2MR2-5 TaxID=2788943 RepID=UPI0018A92A94|nr:hypothetical protein [Aliikangiella sp. G2MR2-5]
MFQVNPNLLWKSGVASTCLMNLSASTVQSVPRGVGEVLDYIGYEKFELEELLKEFTEDRQVVSSYFNYLKERNLIIELKPFIELKELVRKPLELSFISTVWIDWTKDIVPERMKLLLFLREKYSSYNIIIKTDKLNLVVLENALKRLRAQGWHNVALFCPGMVLKSNIEKALSIPFDYFLSDDKSVVDSNVDERVIYYSRKSKNIEGTKDLFCSLRDIRRISGGQENSDSLYLTQEQKLYFHPFDTHYLIGHVTDVKSLKTLLEGERYSEYATWSKDKVEKCSNCEFSLACANPRWFRKKMDDLSSEPENCLYDPKLSVWQVRSLETAYE